MKVQKTVLLTLKVGLLEIPKRPLLVDVRSASPVTNMYPKGVVVTMIAILSGLRLSPPNCCDCSQYFVSRDSTSSPRELAEQKGGASRFSESVM